jgi:hypothetical protein
MNLFQIATRGIDLDSAPITPDDESPREGFRFEEPAQPQQRLRLPAELDEVFALAAQEYEIDPDVLRGIAYAESRFNQDIISGKVKSKAGAIGLMQFMPETAKEYGIEPTDPTQAIIGAAAYLRKSLDKFGGDYERAVASYNWGPNRKAYDSEDWTSKAPAETQKYLQTVFSAAGRFKDGQAERGLPQGVTPSKAGAGRGSVSPGMTNTQDVQAVGRTQQQPTLPADTSAVGSVGSAINTGLAKGVVKTGAGLGTFLQDPGGAIVSGLTGGAALLDRGMSSALSAVGIPAVPNQQVQRNAQIAAESAQQRRGDRYEAGNPLAVAGRFMEEDSRRVFQELQEQDRTQNPRLIAQQKNLSEAEGFVGNLKAAAQNPIALAGTLSESMFPMAAGVGAGSLVSRLGGSMGAVSATGTASEAGFAALNAREGVYQAVATMPLEKLAQSPRFQEILRSGNSPTDARELLANELADQAPLMTAAGTAGGTLLTNRLFGGDATAKTIAGTERMTGKELGKRVAQDTVEEVIQGVPEDLVQYGTLKQADLTKKLDLAGSAAQNMVGGFAFGVAGHGGAFARDAMTTPTVESQPTTPQVPPTVTPQAPVTPDAAKTQAVDNIAAAIKELEGGTTQTAPVQPGQQTADTGTAPVAQGPEGANEGSGYAGTAAATGQSESAQSLKATSYAQRTATPTPLPGAVPSTTSADAGVRAMVEGIKQKRAQDAEETAQIQQMLAEDDAKAAALVASSVDETARGQVAQIAMQSRARLVDDLVSSYAEPSDFFASRVLPAVDKQLAVLGRPPLAPEERRRIDSLLGSTRAFIRPSLPSDTEAASAFPDVGADNASMESLIKEKQPKPAATGLAAEMDALKARSNKPRQNKAPKPLLTDGERDMLADFERMYQADVKGEIKTRLGLLPARQDEAAAPAEKRKPSELLAAIKRAGGIKSTNAGDLMGGSAMDANRILPGLFTKGGMNLDLLVPFLKERGYLTQADEDSIKDNGGVNKLAEILQAELSGDRAQTVDSTAGYESDAEAAMRSDLDSKAFALGLPMKVTNEMSTERLNGVINRIERKLGKPVNTDFATRKMSRTEAMAERQAILMADRVERARAQYDADIQAFAEANDRVQERVLDVMTDEDGNIEVIYESTAGEAYDEGRDSRENSGEVGRPVAQGARAGAGNPEANRTEAGAGQEGLTSYTPAEVTARQDAATEAEATAKRAEDAAARAEAAAKQASEIAQRSVAAADTFELGGNAEDNLSGQEGPRFSRASDGKAARAALAKIMEEGVTSPDDLHALLRVPGYSKWAESTIAGDMAATTALRGELQQAFSGSDWKAPKLNDQGIISVYSDWDGFTAQNIDKLTKLADKYDAPIGVRGGAATKQLVNRLDGFGFELYNGLQERADRMPNVMFGMIRPAGGITATTPLFSQGAKSPRTPAATIRAAITKAYGNLLPRLEGKGLVSLTQTEEEAIAAAAQARADQNGGDVEAIKESLRRSVLASVAPQTESENFKRWFGDSQVVDAAGRPLVVFHGSPQGGFDTFDVDNVGAFFSSRYDIAASYAGRYDDVEMAALDEDTYDENQGVYSTYLQIKSPMVVDWGGKDWGNGPDGLKLDDVANRAKRAGRSADGNLEGFFDPATGKSFLIADNLTAESAPGTLMHEVGIHMAAEGKFGPMFDRALTVLNDGSLESTEALRRMQESGETSGEEAAAYLVTVYETNRTNAPASVKQWMKDFIADVRAWLFSKGVLLKADQLTIADIAAVARANARSMARSGPNGGPGGGIRRSFAGEGAATADKMALATARQRVDAGENAETVRKETGWFKGVDGKWRFEINDKKAKLLPKAMQQPGRLNRATEYLRITYGVTYDIGSPKVTDEQMSASLRWADENKGGVLLDEAIQHDALFAAYPSLRSMRVAITSDPKFHGTYSKETNTITISQGRINEADREDRVLSTLLHEIQHGIQNIEGFATGGTPKNMAKMLDKEKFDAMVAKDDALTAEFEALKKKYSGIADNDLPKGVSEKVRQLRSEINAVRNTGWREATNPFSRGQYTDDELFAGYRRLAGEVEARNTQARQGMTDAQRRETAPSATADTPDSDVIVVFNGKDAMSAPAPANADPDIRRSVRGGGQQAATQTAPAQPVSKWRDSTGRLQFAPGAMLYDFIGDKASPLLSYLGLKMASPALRTQLRRMKAEVTKAQEIAATVATESAKFSEAERNMVSDLVEKTVAAGTIPPDHAVKMAELINMVMGKQTDELVSLGMLSKDSADRWRDEYLPRYYESKMLKKDAWGEAMKIKGKHLKGRGLFETVPVSQQADYESLGWEVRDDGFDPAKDETVMMWRDFTAKERANMGEIKDAGFRFVMGYMQTQKDIALGRMYRSIASDENLSSRLPTDKMTVKVPDTKVADTSVNVYGELAGRYVSPETLSVLSSQSEAQNDVLAAYRKALGLWKEGKTVLNPVSHMNNVVSNITMAHFAGVSYHRGDKYIGAVRDFVYKHKMVTEAKEAGLFSGGFSESELMQSMPAELRALAGKAESKTDKAINTAMQVMTFGLRNKMQNAYGFEDDFFKYLIYKDARSRGATPDAAVDFAQQYIFTYDDLPRGARIVRDTALPFFSYTYKAMPALLHTALTQPHRFAVPAALMTAAATAAYAIASGDDDDDWYESIQKYLFDDEFRKKADAINADDQKRLPPWMKGYMWTLGGIPRSIRVGYDNKLDKPVFLDVSRMMPGGTLIDVSPNSGGIPLFEGITPSHPMLSIGTAMLGNRDLFTGKDVVDKTDNRTEAAKKRADWMWKQIAPAITVGNYHYERVMNMIAQQTGKVSTPFRDYTGIDRMGMPTLPEYGIPHTFGIKLKPIDLELSEQITDSQNAKLIRELDAKVRSLQRMHRKGAVSDEDMSEFRADALEKRKLLRQGLTIDGDER